MLTILLSQHKGSVTLHDGKKCFIALTNHGFHWPIGEIFGTVAVLQKCFSGAGARLQATTVLGLQ